MKQLLVISMVLACWTTVWADTSLVTDSMAVEKPAGFLQRIIRYAVGEDDDTTSADAMKMKWVILGGPYYSTDEKLGLSLSGMLTFRLNGCDPTSQASFFNVSSSVSTAGFVSFGTNGVILFPDDRSRINTNLRYTYSPIRFWGIGYEQGDVDDNECELQQQMLRFGGDYVVQVVPHLYVGPALALDFTHCRRIERPELLEGQDRTLSNYGVGFSLHYDTRDKIENATRGCYFTLKQLFRPRFLGNHYAFSTTSFRASAYGAVWKGGIIAGEIQGMFNFGNPSWAMLAQLGNSNSMRGYYNGRYRDKHSMSAQVELRQHVWKRNSMAVWAGVGNVFHDVFSFGSLLPNYGLGYRFLLRKSLSLRLDYGFGKRGQNGFVMSVNEAF